MSFYNDEGSLTSIFFALGLSEGKPTFQGSKTERWEITMQEMREIRGSRSREGSLLARLTIGDSQVEN